MAKKKKKDTQKDLKKFFEKAKKKMQELGEESKVWMKKGEVELTRLSKMGKLEIDIINLNIKKEKLFRNIGKRVVEQDLSKELSDTTIKSMSGKVTAMINESKKKKHDMSRFRKGLLKGKPTKK